MFDVIGDVHGCYNELRTLLTKLGYLYSSSLGTFFHPSSRRAVFVGDLCDRGPYSPDVLRLVMDMVDSGHALAILGNHCDKLRRYLKGNKVKVAHGLQSTLDQLNKTEDGFTERVMDFLATLSWRLSLDNGKLIVVHAAAPEHLQKKHNSKAKSVALYGVTTGKVTEDGYPERVDWAEDYNGEAVVVHGHVAVKEPIAKNGVYNVDTACVYGNKLTALRYPELEFVSQVALKEYYNGSFQRNVSNECQSDT